MYICKMSYSSAMKKRYQLLKRVSIILIFFVLFTKMHAVEPQYAEPQDIQKTEINELLSIFAIYIKMLKLKNIHKIIL